MKVNAKVKVKANLTILISTLVNTDRQDDKVFNSRDVVKFREQGLPL